jgi:hypothetical protein
MFAFGFCRVLSSYIFMIKFYINLNDRKCTAFVHSLSLKLDMFLAHLTQSREDTLLNSSSSNISKDGGVLRHGKPHSPDPLASSMELAVQLAVQLAVHLAVQLDAGPATLRGLTAQHVGACI